MFVAGDILCACAMYAMCVYVCVHWLRAVCARDMYSAQCVRPRDVQRAGAHEGIWGVRTSPRAALPARAAATSAGTYPAPGTQLRFVLILPSRNHGPLNGSSRGSEAEHIREPLAGSVSRAMFEYSERKKNSVMSA